MLQKLEDFWTYKDWEVLQESDKRPVFGPLRKVRDDSSNISTSDRVRLDDGSGEPKPDNHKTSDKDKTGAIPGWYNIQQWSEQYERQMEMPKYTGYCVRNEEYRQHLDSHCESGSQQTDIDHYPADVYWADESFYRSTQEIEAHNEAVKTGDIRQEIDEDIADLAAELLRGDSVLDVADNMAVRLDCPQWKDRINFSHTYHPRQPPTTRKMKLSDNSDVLVNLIETGYPLQNRRPTSNTKTPCHTPALLVQRHNTFSTIPFSTNALLQRSLNKINFLSTKQKFEPNKPLFRPKSDCEVNFNTYWNSRSQSFFICPNRYHPKTTVNFEQQPISTKAPSCSAATDRKRKSSSDTVVQPTCKRPSTVSNKRTHATQRKQRCMANVDLFAVPVFIPSKTARLSTTDYHRNQRQH